MDIESGKVRVTLRLEPDVYAMLMGAIAENNRSLNNEINARLRDSFVNDSPMLLTTTEKAIQRIIREELAKTVK
ncbi:MAG: TraY domain-containing protein [Thiotrichaceae bacterium]|jgi:hypothetical protein|uniref:Relaxosome protein TraY n=1 Tax=Candidatus Thiocaldithrix dubininis TaxID=3080823 RepID=A0AA95H5W4_9GAMM|nr:MAG: TraY domain-containing protein [Candidatus Thiocaldithrix dubininis]